MKTIAERIRVLLPENWDKSDRSATTILAESFGYATEEYVGQRVRQLEIRVRTLSIAVLCLVTAVLMLISVVAFGVS